MNIWKYVFIFIISSTLLLIAATAPLLDNRLHYVICDVGQGDGILIYHKSTQIIVDAGPDNRILKCLSEHMPFWDRKIELAVLTNPDLDHYGGFVDVFRAYEIDLFVSPGIYRTDEPFRALQKELEAHSIKNSVAVRGQTLQLGEIKLKNEWPTLEYLSEYPTFTKENLGKQVLGATDPGVSVNHWSEVFELQFGAFKSLLTGDIDPPATDNLAESISHTTDVLKVPHHGSKNGLTESLLQKTHPKLAVISDGKNNRYHFPHSEVLNLLNKYGVKVLRTDQVGEIEIITDGRTWRVK
jgi:competence protein ComEC